MIVAERKPFEEIKESVKQYQRILVLGCGTCVSVCLTGGEKEVGVLASMLRMSFKLDGVEKKIGEMTVQRQCEKEFVEPLKAVVGDYDVILSLGCGAGVQFVADMFEEVPVVPGLNTKFIGASGGTGTWEEVCAGCGDCVLAKTAGICPIARCSKRLLNGPCGGSQNGRCEINPELRCAWQMIYDRLRARGQLELLEEIMPPKSWKPALSGGPRKLVREDVMP